MASVKCPNCGNADRKTIEDNGVSPRHPDYTLLCVARVKPSERSWTHAEPEPDDYDAAGLVKCGEQWCPSGGE